MTVNLMERPTQRSVEQVTAKRAARQSGRKRKPQQTGWRLPFLTGSGRRLTLAYIGLWALLYDEIARLMRRGIRLAGTAEQRGERMDGALRHNVAHFENRAVDEVHKLQQDLGHDVTQVQRELMDAGAEFEEELEKRISQMITNLGIPTRERLARLNQELDRLNQKLDEEIRRAQAA